MLSLQKQSGTAAVYVTFRISHQQWQIHILHCNKNVYYCILFARHSVSMLACWCIRAHTDIWVCVCVCLSIFFWCETAGSDCPVFPFPLWLITRVPVNPWYHHRIKRRPPSPREPISSESRTQTGKLLDIFAGPGMVKTSGLKDAPWHHPAVGRSPFRTQHTPESANRKTQSDIKATATAEKGYHDKRGEKYWNSSTVRGGK